VGVAIKAKFGKDKKVYNGLDAIVDDLLEKPLQEHYVIAKVRTARITTDVENGGVETPTVSLEHIEVMLSDKEEAAARKLFEAACKARLGDLPQQTLFDDGKANGEGQDPEGEQGQ
jgi:hypothetical protein